MIKCKKILKVAKCDKYTVEFEYHEDDGEKETSKKDKWYIDSDVYYGKQFNDYNACMIYGREKLTENGNSGRFSCSPLSRYGYITDYYGIECYDALKGKS